MLKKLIIYFFLFGISNAYANISVFPYSIDFEATSNKRVQSVRVINTSNETQTYRVNFVNFKQTENGELIETVEGAHTFAHKYLSWSPRQFTLKPNEMQRINIARKSMAQASDGEFVSHLRISEVSLGLPKNQNESQKSETLSMQLKALFAVTLPVTIYKGDNLHAATTIEKYKMLPDGYLQVTLRRNGTISSRVNIAVINENKKEIGRVNNVKIYLSTDRLNIKIPMDKAMYTHNAQLKLEDARTKKDLFMQAISI